MTLLISKSNSRKYDSSHPSRYTILSEYAYCAIPEGYFDSPGSASLYVEKIRGEVSPSSNSLALKQRNVGLRSTARGRRPQLLLSLPAVRLSSALIPNSYSHP